MMSSGMQVVEGKEDLRDGELLRLFVTGRDEWAFETLIHRHRALVMGTCFRVLGNDADAQDAFQATFLMLARKASSIRQGDTLASWLHRVAYRMSLDLKAALAKRRETEGKAMEISEIIHSDASSEKEGLWQEIRPLLEEEIQRLPARFQAPLILCYLEGKTNEQAAHALDCPVGSLWWRLERGLEILKKRLTHRGVVLTTPLLGTVLAGNASAAIVPKAIITQTTRAAMFIAAGKEAVGISATAVSLFKGALKKMFIKKMQIAGMVLAVSVVGIAVVMASVSERPAGMEQASNSTLKQKRGMAESPMVEPLRTIPEQKVVLTGQVESRDSQTILDMPISLSQNEKTDVKVSKIEVQASAAPYYRIANQPFPETPMQDSTRKWVVIHAELDPHSESMDEVQIKFYVVAQYGSQQKDVPPKTWDVLSSTVTIVNLQRGTGSRRKIIPVFLDSNTVKKYGETVSVMIPEVAVQVWSNGVLKDEFYWKKVPGKQRFWEKYQPKSGVLLNLNQSPWWPAFADYYEQVKPITPPSQ